MAEIIVQNSKKGSQLLRIVIVVVVVIILVGIGYYFWKNYTGKWSGVQPQLISHDAEMPPNFLEDLPIEVGAVLKESYTRPYPDTIQKTISYYSAKSVDVNFRNFLNYAERHTWTIVNKNETEDTIKFFYATKDKNSLSVNVVLEIPSSKVLVTITYLEGK